MSSPHATFTSAREADISLTRKISTKRVTQAFTKLLRKSGLSRSRPALDDEALVFCAGFFQPDLRSELLQMMVGVFVRGHAPFAPGQWSKQRMRRPRSITWTSPNSFQQIQ
jgi:hypothetical protein